MKNKKGVLDCTLLALLVTIGLLHAPMAEAVDMLFSGRLVTAPRCTMTTEPITVNYGLVDVDKLAQSGKYYYEREVVYSPKCVNLTYQDAYTVELVMTGNSASFDNRYLATDVEGLAIQIGINNTVVSINKGWVNKDARYWPDIYALLVKDPKAKLKVGPFNASATLVIMVQ